MMNKKGQGLTEYGIILLLVLGIGMGIWSSSGIHGSIAGMYSEIGTKLKSIIGPETYDTLTKLVDDALGRKSPTYLTNLDFDFGGKKMTILWRKEGGVKGQDGTVTGLQYKVYTVAAKNYQGEGGTMGLMINSYSGSKTDAQGNKIYVDGAYAGAGYTTGTDSSGDYIATYFTSDGQIYEIKDYGNTTDTIMSKYTGDTTTLVTAYYSSDKTKSGSASIATLAEKRSQVIANNIKQ